ncbi:MAG: hypothetical protein RL632_310 [Bacteroidota bacterium]|jgi:hypothetical protein
MERTFQLALCIFFGLIVLFFPMSWFLLTFQQDISNALFLPLVHLFDENTDLTSDAKGLYILVALLFFIAVISGAVLNKFRPEKVEKLVTTLRFACIVFLSMVLMKYGLDKLFKAQFYLPEPNLLYTPLGKLDKDILFWSTMGTSYEYNLFMGMMELIPALLILFSRTLKIGLLIASGVLLNVFVINLSFDISVKLFSFLLLALSVFLLYPYLMKTDQSKTNKIDWQPTKKWMTPLILIIISAEALGPFVMRDSFNDDLTSRPYLHGAYSVVQQNFTEGNPLFDQKIKRVFIHRDGYIIFQMMNDDMLDFKLEIDQVAQRLTLIDYSGGQCVLNYRYSQKTETLAIINTLGTPLLTTKTLNWRKLPVLQKQFHWTVD